MVWEAQPDAQRYRLVDTPPNLQPAIVSAALTQHGCNVRSVSRPCAPYLGLPDGSKMDVVFAGGTAPPKALLLPQPGSAPLTMRLDHLVTSLPPLAVLLQASVPRGSSPMSTPPTPGPCWSWSPAPPPAFTSLSAARPRHKSPRSPARLARQPCPIPAASVAPVPTGALDPPASPASAPSQPSFPAPAAFQCSPALGPTSPPSQGPPPGVPTPGAVSILASPGTWQVVRRKRPACRRSPTALHAPDPPRHLLLLLPAKRPSPFAEGAASPSPPATPGDSLPLPSP